MAKRRKIQMARIEDDQSRMVCFSKRRKGLFKKAHELSALTGARTAVLVVSQAGRSYASVSPSSEPLSSFVDGFLSSHDTLQITTRGPQFSSPNYDDDDDGGGDDLGSSALIGEILSADVGDCEGLDELWALKRSLEEIRERVYSALDLQFVNSLLA